MHVRIDTERAALVFARLLKALRANEYPYNIATLPQAHIPEELRANPLKHAQFLFYVCHYMRGAIQSDYAIRQLVALWRVRPELFIPEQVMHLSAEGVANDLRRAIDYHTQEIAGFWVKNSSHLRQHWGGDPRLIFANGSPDVMRGRIQSRPRATPRLLGEDGGFVGFQSKMASMLAYFLMDAELIDPCAIAPAVDFHILRALLATEVLQIEIEGAPRARFEQLHKHGVAVIEEYCRAKKVATAQLGDALWILSTTLCRISPANASVGRTRARVPREEKKIPQPLVIDTTNPDHILRYSASCHQCPANKWCRWAIPSGPYYEVGLVIPRERPTLVVPQRLFHPRRTRAALTPGVLLGESESGVPCYESPPQEIPTLL